MVDKSQFATTAEGEPASDEVREIQDQQSLAALYGFFQLLDAWDRKEEQP